MTEEDKRKIAAELIKAIAATNSGEEAIQAVLEIFRRWEIT